MNKVICDSIGKCDECPFCGAAVPHYETSCEPCPFVKEARCVPVFEGLTEEQAKELDEKPQEKGAIIRKIFGVLVLALILSSCQKSELDVKYCNHLSYTATEYQDTQNWKVLNTYYTDFGHCIPDTSTSLIQIRSVIAGYGPHGEFICSPPPTFGRWKIEWKRCETF